MEPAAAAKGSASHSPISIAANLARLEQAALAVYQRGHVPGIGEWVGAPFAAAAGFPQGGGAGRGGVGGGFSRRFRDRVGERGFVLAATSLAHFALESRRFAGEQKDPKRALDATFDLLARGWGADFGCAASTSGVRTPAAPECC